ncbi:copper chaperone for superoxide dismutase-like isoform X2 [Mercenaria mercenaria]|uniref:copper chaperone for superoxide dismutase-like isoform X2 n=1 Tax=Mercenaria mercenaria TaxID=6596 RepID=UPI00234F06A7|nr:copper chaperone for superoxide dismutase-like isoform X2 [Mercenaria mercenaria]
MDAPTKLEFDVELTCEGCVKSVKKAFEGVTGINSLDVDLTNGQVLVEGNLGSDKVKSIIESTGRRAILKGMGGTETKAHLGAAVSIMEAGSDVVRGLIRFVQTDKDKLVIDGTIDGLSPGKHALCMHECGDISDGCESCGDVFGIEESNNKTAVGDFGDIEVGPDGRAEFRFVNDRLKVWEMIGRSMMIHNCPSTVAHQRNNGQDGRISCGIIARSAGLFQNPKRFCACDGVAQWEERNKPVAGAGRQSNL